MSNLLKFNMVVCDEHIKVIDYNDAIEERLSELRKKHSIHTENAGDGEFSEDGFGAGLAFKEIEVVEEEPEAPSPEEILLVANEEAEQILTEAKKAAENIKNQAYDEGSAKGYAEAKAKADAELNAQQTALNEQEQAMRQHYQKLEKEMEATIVPALTSVYEKIFHVQLSEQKDLILHLLDAALGNSSASHNFIIHAAKEDYLFLEEQKEQLLKRLKKDTILELIEDGALVKNQCLIETDGGVFDCSLDIQLENLKKAILLLSEA